MSTSNPKKNQTSASFRSEVDAAIFDSAERLISRKRSALRARVIIFSLFLGLLGYAIIAMTQWSLP